MNSKGPANRIKFSILSLEKKLPLVAFSKHFPRILGSGPFTNPFFIAFFTPSVIICAKWQRTTPLSSSSRKLSLLIYSIPRDLFNQSAKSSLSGSNWLEYFLYHHRLVLCKILEMLLKSDPNYFGCEKSSF